MLKRQISLQQSNTFIIIQTIIVVSILEIHIQLLFNIFLKDHLYLFFPHNNYSLLLLKTNMF